MGLVEGLVGEGDKSKMQDLSSYMKNLEEGLRR
jgi:hypothetical protein